MTLVNADTGEIVDSFEVCEQIIADGLDTFVRVGQALIVIKENGWHRDHGYRSLDDYCERRWGFGRRRGEQLVAAAKVMGDLTDGDANSCSHPLPTHESQTRPLAKLPTPEAKRDAWAEANRTAQAEGRQTTAKDVETIVRKVIEQETVKKERRDDDRRAIDNMADAAGLPRRGTPEAKEADRRLDVIATALGWIRDFDRRDIHPAAEVIALAEETDRDVLRRASVAHEWLTDLLAETERKFG